MSNKFKSIFAEIRQPKDEDAATDASLTAAADVDEATEDEPLPYPTTKDTAVAKRRPESKEAESRRTRGRQIPSKATSPEQETKVEKARPTPESEIVPGPSIEHAYPPLPAGSGGSQRAGTKERTRGKSSDPEYTQITAYIRKQTHRATKVALLEGEDREISTLIGELLEKWLKQQKSN